MAIEFHCQSCKGTLQVEDDVAGRLIRCGACMTTLRVPAPGDEPTDLSPDHAHPKGEEHPPYAEPDLDVDRSWPPRRSRRRRRPPPPPRGRGPLFWFILVVGILMLGSCALCGVVALVLPGPKWHTHQPPQGGYRVELPAQARNIKNIPGVKQDPNMKTEGAFLLSRVEEYAIVSSDILPRSQRLLSDDEVIDAGLNEISIDPDCRRMVRNVKTTVSGFAAREFEFLGTDGGTRVGRIIVADSRCFVIIAGGRFTSPGNTNVRRFLNSFEVTDPALVRPRFPRP